MRFIFYTDKTIPQSIAALNERVQGSGKLQGRAEKGSSHFSLSTSSKVLNQFTRTTQLHGTLSREEGITVIKVYVSEGMERARWFLLFLGVLLLTFIFYITGNALLAILTILVGAWSYIPLIGDAQNSDSLLRTLKSTLGAKETKPKPAPPGSSAAARSTATSRPGASPSPFGARPAPPASRPSSTSNPSGKSNPPRK